MSAPQLARERRLAAIAGLPLVAAEVGTVRPGRVRNRTTKTEPEEKVKKPADGVRNKKSPPARKAPARGRYVDEYARPSR
jgi:hypothetical protein